MFLSGQLQPAAAELTITSPWDGRVVGTVPSDTAADVRDAATTLKGSWRAMTPAERAAVLGRAADLLRQRAEELAPRISAESGVCVKETRREVQRASGNLAVAAEEALRLRGESILVPGHPRLAITLCEPVGVVAAITPYNRPLNQVVVKVAPAIAAGCPVVLKPSEKTPLAALAFAQVLCAAGLPAGNIAVTTGPPLVIGPALAGHPDVDMVTFTGGTSAGLAVAAAAAGKKVVLELGGNDPLIVAPDADLALAIRLAVSGAFGTAGQSCRGVKRIIAVGGVAERMAGPLAAAAAALRVGDPLDPEVDIGPLISADAAEIVAGRIDDAVAAGARLLQGGRRDGAVLAPAVLDRVPADAELVVEETFGPVAPIIRVGSLAEAIEVANSTAYGLQAGVLTRDSEAFWQAACCLRVGAVHLGEGPHFDSPHIPFGGVKASGVGREGIRYSIREMTSIKTVTVPYGPGAGGSAGPAGS
jgi:acyl-CoA reductase-like NAD-dependent aldehyde dehydrogenase